jgi:hypothetical protein
MNQSLQLVLPALLGLLGTFFGLWLGHWRWSSELRMNKRRAFDARRHAAYEELWSILENAHITIRTGRPETGDVLKLEQQINAFCLRNAIFLEPADAALSTEYFNGLVQLSRVIAASGSRDLQEQFTQTNTFASSEIHEVSALVQANEVVGALREKLILRTRAVMLETSYAASSAR